MSERKISTDWDNIIATENSILCIQLTKYYAIDNIKST